MEDIFKISRDIIRAKYLFDMANERRAKIIPALPRDIAYKLVEEYYEVIVQLITGIMYFDGYKTLSHISLVEYLSGNYKEVESREIGIIDMMRKLRHGIIYYGERAKKEFLINNEEDINRIINKLFKILGGKLKFERKKELK